MGMKILQFTKKTPIPPKDGESIAIHQLSQAFVENGCALTVLSMLTPKHPTADQKQAIKNVDYQNIKIDTSLSVFDLLKNIVQSEKPYITERFFKTEVEQKLIELLQQNTFDVIQLESVFLGDYIDTIRKYSKANIVLRAHNVEHQIWQRMAKKMSYLKRMYLQKIMIPRLQKMEEIVAKKVDYILCISALDAQFFKQKTAYVPVRTLPATYQVQKITPLPKTFNIGFIGGLDWQPNLQGIKWFLNNVWQTFSKENPQAILNLAGRNFPQELYDLQNENLFIFGEVADAKAFTLQNSAMIVPILSGSGMRIKIVEAMALGRTVISTSVGAEGINYTNQKDIFIANSATEWIKTLKNLMQNPSLLEQTAYNAQKIVEKDHDIEILGAELVQHYKTLWE